MEESQLHIHGLIQEREEAISKVTSIVAALVGSGADNEVFERRVGSNSTVLSKRKLVGVDAMATGLEPRRRTASFRPYKIPRVLKEKRRVKKVGGKEVEFTARCRKHRRRPHILLSKYAILGCESRWLQTHMWHRKRMFMEKRWNTWLGIYNRGRGMARKLASAPSAGCVMHDESYLFPLELKGERGSLRSLLQHFLDPGEPLLSSQEGNPRNESKNLSSFKEVDFLIYQKDRFPNGRLGPVSMTTLAADANQWHMLLWLHPALSEEVVKAFEETAKDMCDEGKVEVTSPELGLCRFALRGRGVIQLLAHFLLSAEGSSDNFADDSPSALLTALAKCSPRAVNKVWPLNHCMGIPVRSLGTHEQRVVSRPEDSPRRPRGPKPRLDWNSDSAGHRHIAEFVLQHGHQRSVAAHETAGASSSSVVLIRRDDCLSHGRLSDEHVVKKDQRLSGVDVLVPVGMARALWCALILQGAEVWPIGYGEMAYLRLCAGIPSFPQDYPETPAGKAYWLHRTTRATNINMRLPPRKRVHLKLQVLSAVAAPRDALVVREGRYLEAFEKNTPPNVAPGDVGDAMDDEEDGESSSSDDGEEEDGDVEEEDAGKQGSNTSVPVLIKAVSRGGTE